MILFRVIGFTDQNGITHGLGWRGLRCGKVPALTADGLWDVDSSKTDGLWDVGSDDG